jgi:hypothetical protein
MPTASDGRSGQPIAPSRRRIMTGAALMAATASSAALAQVQSVTEAPQFDGNPVPEPGSDKSAGAIRSGRGSQLAGKVAVVTGAARGIGRAIAVEMAANGADVVAIDIAGPVSPASNAKPATPEDLAETVRQIKSFGRKGESIQADIRDISSLRAAADKIEKTHGKIDIVVADAAIQRWVPLLEMQDADWRDVIDNNLNGTANTIRAFAPKMVAAKRAASSFYLQCRVNTAPKTHRAILLPNGASSA